MKVVMDALIFQKDPHGGIARMICELLPRLADLDPKLEITMVSDGRLHGSLPEHERITLRRLPPVRLRLRPQGAVRNLLYPLRRGAGRVWEVFRQWRLGDGGGAIWHSTYYTMPERWRGPQVVCLHDLIPENHPEAFADRLDEIGRQQKRRCVEKAQLVVCVSEATRREAIGHYSLAEERTRVIHHAAGKVFRRLKKDEPALEGAPMEPFLLYVGNRAPYKNFDLLLAAFAGWERCSEIGLAVVGKPWQPTERRRLAVLGVESRVVQMENISDEDLCQLYNRAVALVFPSLEEGFGLPLVEAMACGCPIVASDIPSTREVAADVPIYFDPRDVDACRLALDQAWLERGQGSLQERALARAAIYSWDTAAHAWLDVYRSLIRKD